MTPKKVLFGLTVSLIAACSQNNPASPDPNPQNDMSSPAQSSDTAKVPPDKIKKRAEQSFDENTSPAGRSAGSHTHGDAKLAIVVEGNVVTIELDTPLYNILGFEHEPATEAQKTRVTRTENILGTGRALFTFNNTADCNLKSESQDVHLFNHDDEHDNHDDEHDENDDDKGHHDDHDEAHKDVILQYEFQCAAPSALKNVSINLFELFDELAEIDVTYLGPSTQRQVKMTPDNSQMDM